MSFIYNLERDLSSFLENSREKSIRFKDYIEKANKIVLVGDTSLDPLIYYTFYFLAKHKKVLISRDLQLASKITSADLIISFKKEQPDTIKLELIGKEDQAPIWFELKVANRFHGSALLPYLLFLISSDISSLDSSIIISEINKNLKEFKGVLESVERELVAYGRCFCLGRAQGYAIASEICAILTRNLHIHGESYPAGESKHGPIALIESGFPVIQIIDSELHAKKMVNSIMEMSARGGKIIVISHLDNDFYRLVDYGIHIKSNSPKNQTLSHIIYIIIGIAMSKNLF